MDHETSVDSWHCHSVSLHLQTVVISVMSVIVNASIIKLRRSNTHVNMLLASVNDIWSERWRPWIQLHSTASRCVVLTMLIGCYLGGWKTGSGNFGCVWQVDGSSEVGMWPSMKNSALSIYRSEGRPAGSKVNRQQMRSRAVIETWGGIVYLLFTIRM